MTSGFPVLKIPSRKDISITDVKLLQAIVGADGQGCIARQRCAAFPQQNVEIPGGFEAECLVSKEMQFLRLNMYKKFI